LTIALAGALAPTTVLAQDDEAGASDQGSKKGGKGADKGAKSDEGGDAADADKAKGDEESKPAEAAPEEAPQSAEMAAFDRGEDPNAKPKHKKKPKPPPPKDEQVSGSSIEAGVLVGWGFQPWYHLGAGLRVGANLSDIYVGGTAIYAFGQSLEDKSRVAGFTFKDSGNFMLFGGEIGYNLALEGFLVRPILGIGVSLTPREACDPECQSATGTHAYLAPGAALLYPIDPVFVGLDARYNVVLGLSDGSGAMISATGGIRL
jgi:hypothetical protein